MNTTIEDNEEYELTAEEFEFQIHEYRMRYRRALKLVLSWWPFWIFQIAVVFITLFVACHFRWV